MAQNIWSFSPTPNRNTIRLFQNCLAWRSIISLKFVQCPHHVFKPSRERKSCCVYGEIPFNSTCLCCWTLKHTTLDTATQWGIEWLVQRWNVRLPLLSKQYYLKLRSFRCNENAKKSVKWLILVFNGKLKPLWGSMRPKIFGCLRTT